MKNEKGTKMQTGSYQEVMAFPDRTMSLSDLAIDIEYYLMDVGLSPAGVAKQVNCPHEWVVTVQEWLKEDRPDNSYIAENDYDDSMG
jgi:hypothetical protein